MDPEELCNQVIELTKKVGNFIQKEAEVFDLESVEFKGYNDLVSYVDKGSEKLLTEGLQEIFPEAGIMAEEGTVSNEEADYQWIIDPLDGTTNFVHGVPVYAISVALQKSETIQLGVIYEINSNKCFYAWRGGGTWCNGEEIHVSGNRSLEESLIATGFPTRYFDKLPLYMPLLEDLIRNTQGVRRTGSAATDLAYVAAGIYDGFFEHHLKPWDVAAGILLVKEAGGKVTDFRGGKEYLMGPEICAAGKVHKPFLERIQKYWDLQKEDGTS